MALLTPRRLDPPAAPQPRVRALRDAERTQAAILAAATQEFARHGLGGARVDRIAARAKTNKRMLYYYFGSKEALFLAVLESAYARIRTAEQELRLLDAARRPKACAGWSSSRGTTTSRTRSS